MSVFWGKPEVILHQSADGIHLVLLSDPFRVREIFGFEGCFEICYVSDLQNGPICLMPALFSRYPRPQCEADCFAFGVHMKFAVNTLNVVFHRIGADIKAAGNHFVG